MKSWKSWGLGVLAAVTGVFYFVNPSKHQPQPQPSEYYTPKVAVIEPETPQPVTPTKAPEPAKEAQTEPSMIAQVPPPAPVESPPTPVYKPVETIPEDDTGASSPPIAPRTLFMPPVKASPPVVYKKKEKLIHAAVIKKKKRASRLHPRMSFCPPFFWRY